jgi:putative NADPH-quinone reductase
MAKRILVINGNPDPAPERLSAALAAAYIGGAKAKKHEVRRLDIGALDFSVMRRAQEFATEPGEDSVINARADLLWANHIVFVFPLWLGGPPALFKAFMEQVARHEFALGPGRHGLPAGKLKGRSARVIVTMGMPAPVYQLWFGAFGVKAFTRSILGMAGISPVAITYLGSLSEARCRKWVARAGALGARGA